MVLNKGRIICGMKVSELSPVRPPYASKIHFWKALHVKSVTGNEQF